MRKLKLAYFGSPIFSTTLLEKLILDKSLGIEVTLVVTQPDKPVGRKMLMTPSPVKVVAKKYGIPLFNTASRNEGNDIFATRDVRSGIGSVSEQARGDKNDIAEMSFFDELKQVDLGLVYAYGFGQLIPLDLLRAPKMQFEIGEGKTSGFVNVHPSLLPQYRGSSPIAYPILLGENKTGVTLFVMDEKMDHGPIIDQQEMKITLTDVRSDMEKKLTDLGFEMVKKFLFPTDPPIRRDRLRLIQQKHSLATRSPYMTKDDGFIPLPVLQKALKNEPLTLQELPHIIRKYYSRHPDEGRGQVSNADSSQPPRLDSIQNDRTSEVNRWHVREDVPERKKIQNLLQNSSMTIFNFWRGMHPWPGLWTLIQPPRLDMTKDDKAEPGEPPRLDTIKNDRTSEVKLAGKRLKILNMEFVQAGHAPSLHIITVQLEGKSPVDFPTFQKAYKIF